MMGNFIVLEVNRNYKFDDMTELFYKQKYTLIILFFILGVVDFTLIELTNVERDCNNAKCAVLDDDQYGLKYIIRVMTTLNGVLIVFIVFAFWERISYFCSIKAWSHSILYVTIVGYIWLVCSRIIEPPIYDENRNNNNNNNNDSNDDNDLNINGNTSHNRSDNNNIRNKWSWNKQHNTADLLYYFVVIVVIIHFLSIYVLLITALISDMYIKSSKGDVTENIQLIVFLVAFIFVANIILLIPSVVGSALVNIYGSFLIFNQFVILLGDQDLYKSMLVSLGVILFINLLATIWRWFIGKKSKKLRIWSIFNLPPKLLAMSDCFLFEMNYTDIAIIGTLFGETINCVNKGRIGISLFKTIITEFVNIPSILALFVLGCTLSTFTSAVEVNNSEILSVSIPIIILLYGLWKLVSFSWGIKKFNSKSKDLNFWTSLEKWKTIQHIYQIGYLATKSGWNGSHIMHNDCFELSISRNKSELPLFDKIYNKFKSYNKQVKMVKKQKYTGRNICCKPQIRYYQKTIKEQIELQIQIKAELNQVRMNHYDSILNQNDILLTSGALIERPTNIFVRKPQNAFTTLNNQFIHIVIALLLFGLGISNFFEINRKINFEEYVKNGIEGLSQDITITGWILLSWYTVLLIIYFSLEIGFYIKKICRMIYLSWSYKFNNDMETKYPTPTWNNDLIDFGYGLPADPGLFKIVNDNDNENDIELSASDNDTQNNDVSTNNDNDDEQRFLL